MLRLSAVAVLLSVLDWLFVSVVLLSVNLVSLFVLVLYVRVVLTALIVLYVNVVLLSAVSLIVLTAFFVMLSVNLNSALFRRSLLGLRCLNNHRIVPEVQNLDHIRRSPDHNHPNYLKIKTRNCSSPTLSIYIPVHFTVICTNYYKYAYICKY